MKYSITLLLIGLLMFSCGKPPKEAGDEALKNGQYGEAIKLYTEALKTDPDTLKIKESIARAFFMQGEKIYTMRKVLSALEARIDLGMQNLPQEISPEMKQYTAKMQLLMAEAFIEAPIENDYQKKEYFDKALQYLEDANWMDPGNKEIEQKLADFKKQHFEDMLNKGKIYLQRGKNDPAQYLTAQYYLEKAHNFNPDDALAADLLKTVLKKTLNVLDPSKDFPMAITEQLYHEYYLANQIVLQNLSGKSVPVDASHFYLVDYEGKSYQGESSELFEGAMQKRTLNDGTETEGVVAFSVKKNRFDFLQEKDYRDKETSPFYENQFQ